MAGLLILSVGQLLQVAKLSLLNCRAFCTARIETLHFSCVRKLTSGCHHKLDDYIKLKTDTQGSLHSVFKGRGRQVEIGGSLNYHR